MENKHLLIVSYGKYPDGNAGAVRQHAFAKLFSECGYKVTVIGMGDSTGGKVLEYDKIAYTSFRREPNSYLNRVLNWLIYCSNLMSFLKKHKDITDILIVKTYFLSTFKALERYAKKNNINLFHDSVEWYSPEEFTLPYINPGYLKNNKMNAKVIDKKYKVFAISTYLENRFAERGIDTIRVPVIMDSATISTEKTTIEGKTVIVYAGRIGNKDKIDTAIEAIMSMSDEEKKDLEFRVIGTDLNTASKFLGISMQELNKHNESIKFLGRVKRQEVLANLQEADFTILMRDEKLRFAKAGFPTKVVESLMSGTPVICNLSSDLGLYLKDENNSIISKSFMTADVKEAILKAKNMTLAQRQLMQKNARDTAENKFDYRKFVELVANWVK